LWTAYFQLGSGQQAYTGNVARIFSAAAALVMLFFSQTLNVAGKDVELIALQQQVERQPRALTLT
jgi:hypothetical protein